MKFVMMRTSDRQQAPFCIRSLHCACRPWGAHTSESEDLLVVVVVERVALKFQNHQEARKNACDFYRQNEMPIPIVSVLDPNQLHCGVIFLEARFYSLLPFFLANVRG